MPIAASRWRPRAAIWRRTREAKLLFVEQPLAHDDLAGLKALTRAKVPIGIDEGIHSLADIEANAQAGADGISLKLIKLGGITQALAAGRLAGGSA